MSNKKKKPATKKKAIETKKNEPIKESEFIEEKKPIKIKVAKGPQKKFLANRRMYIITNKL